MKFQLTQEIKARFVAPLHIAEEKAGQDIEAQEIRVNQKNGVQQVYQESRAVMRKLSPGAVPFRISWHPSSLTWEAMEFYRRAG